MRNGILLFIYICITSFLIIQSENNWKNKVYVADAAGYHLYLPASIIYHDIEKLSFYSHIDTSYPALSGADEFGIFNMSNGRKVNKYTMGVALGELPFFLIAHLLNTTLLDYTPDGYSMPYQYASKFSMMFWAGLGIVLMISVVERLFNKVTALITGICIAFGTNLYHSATYDMLMSHSFSFFLTALLLYSTFRLYSQHKVRYIYLIGIILGLITITRVSNIIFILLPLLWGVYNYQTLSNRMSFFRQHIYKVLAATLLFILTITPQFLYWKTTTGSYLFFSYQNEGFIWSDPEIIKGLFGFRKGWFIYTPIAFLACIGFIPLYRLHKGLIVPITTIILINIYIVFSWWNWWYGGSFGCRPLIETYSILSIPLAALIYQVYQQRIAIKILMSLLLFSFIALNIIQTYQYTKAIIHWDRMSFNAYKKTFLKFNNPDNPEQYLMPDRDYYNELGERYHAINPENE